MGIVLDMVPIVYPSQIFHLIRRVRNLVCSVLEMSPSLALFGGST